MANITVTSNQAYFNEDVKFFKDVYIYGTLLATARTIGITSDLNWSVSFDGSQNVSGIGTLSTTGVTAATYGSGTQVPQFTVDAKGRITSASNVNISFSSSSVGYANSAGITTNIRGGSQGSIPYQSAVNTTTFLNDPNVSGRVLTWNDVTNTPQWSDPISVGVGTTSPGSFTLTSTPFFRNTSTITENYTVQSSAFNEMSIGPITINSGVTVTVNSGATWTII